MCYLNQDAFNIYHGKYHIKASVIRLADFVVGVRRGSSFVVS